MVCSFDSRVSRDFQPATHIVERSHADGKAQLEGERSAFDYLACRVRGCLLAAHRCATLGYQIGYRARES
jgi:hypothetical protein